TAGVQKWRLINGTWMLQYVLQDGLDLGIPYSVANYPVSLNPATDGCRNITGRRKGGTVTIYAVTSTVSNNADQGADPNKLLKVDDLFKATSLPKDHGRKDKEHAWGHFVTIRSAPAGEVFRGIAFAPKDQSDDDDHDN